MSSKSAPAAVLCSKVQGAELGMVLLGGCMSRDLEKSDINMGFRLFFHSVNKLQVHKEGL